MFSSIQTAEHLCKKLKISKMEIDYLLCDELTAKVSPKENPLITIWATEMLNRLYNQRSSRDSIYVPED